MTWEQFFILGLLVALFVLFLRGPWRYDVVAFVALLVATSSASSPGSGPSKASAIPPSSPSPRS